MKENQTISSWILEQSACYRIIKDLKYFELDKQRIGNWITTQQEKTSKANKEWCILLKILASIYLLESFTWIPIQILYWFTAILKMLRNIKPLVSNSHNELGSPVISPVACLVGSAREHKMNEETSLGYCLVSF